MFQKVGQRVDVLIDLENGIYVFNQESATGKTRLFKVFEDYNRVKKEIGLFTYHADYTKADLCSLLKCDYKIFMLDRFDLYSEWNVEYELEELGKRAIVLIASKNTNNVRCCNRKRCIISNDYSNIEVYK